MKSSFMNLTNEAEEHSLILSTFKAVELREKSRNSDVPKYEALSNCAEDFNIKLDRFQNTSRTAAVPTGLY
jgi:hypothetical protein